MRLGDFSQYIKGSVNTQKARLMMVKRIILLLNIGSLFLAGCAKGAMPSPIPTLAPKPTAVIETRLTAAERAAIFDTVWQTLNDKYFDPTFTGKDWQAIGEEYRKKLVQGSG